MSLDLPGSGSITVTVDSIEVRGPDEPTRDQVFAQLGTWAVGQWVRAQGFTAINGSCVALNERTIVLTGPPRVGCSLLALVLIERGWSLTSDGIVAWGADEVPLILNDAVTADRSVVIGLDQERVITAASGRDRVRVHCASIGSGRLAGSVLVGRRAAIEAPRIVDEAHTDPLSERLATTPIPALIHGGAAPECHVSAIPGIRLLRPWNGGERVLRASSPPVLVDLIESRLRDFCS